MNADNRVESESATVYRGYSVGGRFREDFVSANGGVWTSVYKE